MKRHLFAMVMLLAGSAFAQQRAPEISFTSVPNYPNLPDGMNFGEVSGVAVDSKGNVYVAENRGKRIHKFRPVT